MRNIDKLVEVIKETFGCDGDVTELFADDVNAILDTRKLDYETACHGFKCQDWKNNKQRADERFACLQCDHALFWEREYEEEKEQ